MRVIVEFEGTEESFKSSKDVFRKFVQDNKLEVIRIEEYAAVEPEAESIIDKWVEWVDENRL